MEPLSLGALVQGALNVGAGLQHWGSCCNGKVKTRDLNFTTVKTVTNSCFTVVGSLYI
jgi:hypothetical protein